MTPQAWIAVIGVAVALGTFLLGRASKRWTDQGSMEARAAALKEATDRLQAAAEHNGQRIAALEAGGFNESTVREFAEGAARREEQIHTLTTRCAACSQDLTKRVNKLEYNMTVLRVHLGYEDTGKHFTGPFRGRGSGGGEDSGEGSGGEPG